MRRIGDGRVQTSCGYAVPRMDYVEQRDTLIRWTNSKSGQALKDYRREKNTSSIDALPTPLLECAELIGET